MLESKKFKNDIIDQCLFMYRDTLSHIFSETKIKAGWVFLYSSGCKFQITVDYPV